MAVSALDQLIAVSAAGVGVSADGLEFTGHPVLESFYPVSALASASVGVAGLAAVEVLEALELPRARVVVDRGLADAWFGLALSPVGWELAPAPDHARTPVSTPWGAAELLPSPLTVGGHPLAWALPPRPLGSDDPLWE